MKSCRSVATWSSSLLLAFFLLFNCEGAQAQSGKSIKDTCSEPKPTTLCNASNTCGSVSVPCTVDVKRTAEAAEATANIPNAHGNATFCVKPGTTITWQSTSKNTGFVMDFESSSPFNEGTIIGGSDRTVSTVAKKEGCYKYSAGACVSGAIYGMCGTANAEMIVLGDGR